MATRPRTENNPFAYGMRLLAVFYNEMEKNKDKISFIKSYQEIEKNLGKMYDPVIGRFVLDNWDKVITVLQKDENSPEVLIQ